MGLRAINSDRQRTPQSGLDYYSGYSNSNRVVGRRYSIVEVRNSKSLRSNVSNIRRVLNYKLHTKPRALNEFGVLSFQGSAGGVQGLGSRLRARPWGYIYIYICIIDYSMLFYLMLRNFEGCCHTAGVVEQVWQAMARVVRTATTMTAHKH